MTEKIIVTEKQQANWPAFFETIPVETLELDLSETNIKDMDLAALSRFPDLQVLILSDTDISSATCLAKLPNLVELDISGTKTDALDFLDKLPTLKKISAYDTNISDLSHLEKLSLKELRLGRSAISSLKPLKTMHTLEVINLQGCKKVSDIGPLSQLLKLREVDLSGTQIKDPNALNVLESLPKLMELHVNPEIEFAARAVLRHVTSCRNTQSPSRKDGLFATSETPNKDTSTSFSKN